MARFAACPLRGTLRPARCPAPGEAHCARRGALRPARCIAPGEVHCARRGAAPRNMHSRFEVWRAEVWFCLGKNEARDLPLSVVRTKEDREEGGLLPSKLGKLGFWAQSCVSFQRANASGFGSSGSSGSGRSHASHFGAPRHRSGFGSSGGWRSSGSAVPFNGQAWPTTGVPLCGGMDWPGQGGLALAEWIGSERASE